MAPPTLKTETLLWAKPAGVGAFHPDVDQLRRLAEIGRALTYTTTLDQVARIAVESGARLLNATAAELMLAGADGLFYLRAAHGIDEALLARSAPSSQDAVIAELEDLLDARGSAFIAVPLVVGDGGAPPSSPTHDLTVVVLVCRQDSDPHLCRAPVRFGNSAVLCKADRLGLPV